MGCGASAAPPRECADAEKKELCDVHGKQMLSLCVPPALEKLDEIKVVPPKELNNLRESAESLRKQADSAREQTAAKDDEPKTAVGGIAGSIIGAVANVGEKANELFGKGLGVVLDEAAKSLDAAVDTVEKPMTEIGKDIVEAKKAEVEKVFKYVIGTLSFDGEPGGAVALVRGAAPHGRPEYEAIQGSPLSDFFVSQCAQKLAAQLRPEIQEEIDKHTAVKAWDKAIEAYNFASGKLEEAKLPSFAKIELDINEHIIDQIVSQLAVLIGKTETVIRHRSGDVKVCKPVQSPTTFAAVFSGERLTEAVYKKREI